MTHSGLADPRLGLNHSSGWSSLSHGHGERPMPSGSSHMYGRMDFGAIADAAVDEMFGSDDDYGRVGPRRRAFRAGKRRMKNRVASRRAARHAERAAVGSPAWQQGVTPGQGYSTTTLLAPDVDNGIGSDLLDVEIDALLAEDDEDDGSDEGAEYGYDADDYYGFDEDEFGFDEDDEYGDDDDDDDDLEEMGRDDDIYLDSFGRLRHRHPRRHGLHRGMRKLKRKVRRHRNRHENMVHGPFPFRDNGEGNLHQGMMVPSGASRYGDAPAPLPPPPSHTPSFGESVIMGAGVGLGFMVAAVGVSALVRGLGAK